TFTVRFPSRVVTTTFETRGLSRKVRVSVRTPFSFVVVISELSGAVVVEVVVGATFEFALAFDVLSLVQLEVISAKAPATIAIKSFLFTASPPSTLKHRCDSQ